MKVFSSPRPVTEDTLLSQGTQKVLNLLLCFRVSFLELCGVLSKRLMVRCGTHLMNLILCFLEHSVAMLILLNEVIIQSVGVNQTASL